MVASLQRELDNARVSSVRSYCSPSYETAMTSSPFMGLISIIELSSLEKENIEILDHFDAAYTVYCK